jgi:hypothetical protein
VVVAKEVVVMVVMVVAAGLPPRLPALLVISKRVVVAVLLLLLPLLLLVVVVVGVLLLALLLRLLLLLSALAVLWCVPSAVWRVTAAPGVREQHGGVGPTPGRGAACWQPGAVGSGALCRGCEEGCHVCSVFVEWGSPHGAR